MCIQWDQGPLLHSNKHGHITRGLDIIIQTDVFITIFCITLISICHMWAMKFITARVQTRTNLVNLSYLYFFRLPVYLKGSIA